MGHPPVVVARLGVAIDGCVLAPGDRPRRWPRRNGHRDVVVLARPPAGEFVWGKNSVRHVVQYANHGNLLNSADSESPRQLCRPGFW